MEHLQLLRFQLQIGYELMGTSLQPFFLLPEVREDQQPTFDLRIFVSCKQSYKKHLLVFHRVGVPEFRLCNQR
jgi:hypothetical protein